MAKLAKGGFLCAAIEKTQYLIKKPRTKVREKQKRGVEFPGHNKVKAVIERHPAMFRQNHTAGCLPCENGTAKYLQTRWRHKGTAVPVPNRRRQPTPEQTPTLRRTQYAPIGNNSRAQRFQIINMPAGYAYLHTSLPCAESFTLYVSDQDSQNDTDFDPDMLTDE